jgi:hypothetical protein
MSELFKKRKGPFAGPLLHINFILSVYKNPLSLFKVKKEVVKRDKIIVHNIHLSVLSACKIIYFFQENKEKFTKSGDFV